MKRTKLLVTLAIILGLASEKAFGHFINDLRDRSEM